MTEERNTVTAGISTRFVKGRMGNSFGFVGPMASVTIVPPEERAALDSGRPRLFQQTFPHQTSEAVAPGPCATPSVDRPRSR